MFHDQYPPALIKYDPDNADRVPCLQAPEYEIRNTNYGGKTSNSSRELTGHKWAILSIAVIWSLIWRALAVNSKHRPCIAPFLNSTRISQLRIVG